jgi:hypothetical protein
VKERISDRGVLNRGPAERKGQHKPKNTDCQQERTGELNHVRMVPGDAPPAPELY